MHDIDRAMFEFEQEAYETEEVAGEAQQSHESYESYEAFEANEQSEALEMELAARLLEVASEEELEEFLGSLVRSAASAARGFAASTTGRALGGVLKNAARQVLPKVGRVLGDAVVPGLGGSLGASAGRWLGQQFELEGLSAEDREFELARAFVRVARDATRAAVRTGPTAPPGQVATAAVVAAARRSLPGLVPVITQGGLGPAQRRSGRWVRRGNRVVVLGA